LDLGRAHSAKILDFGELASNVGHSVTFIIILQWERKANLSRFEGSSSISSAEYFGTGSSHNSGGGSSHLTATDLEDVKESVRQGVTKVAGKLSSIANDVMSSIQVSKESYALSSIKDLF
jgi:hypothetical protein